MSEENKKEVPPNPKAKTKKTPAAEMAEQKKKQSKRIWTLALCKKYARRFPNEDGWKHGAPSSYKAACSHGWRNDCLQAMHEKQRNITHKKVAAA